MVGPHFINLLHSLTIALHEETCVINEFVHLSFLIFITITNKVHGG